MNARHVLIGAALLALLAAHAHAQHGPIPAAPGGAPAPRHAGAQQATASIFGLVADEAGRPIGAASVIVTDLRDTSAIANGALTGADGRFHVAGLAQSHYALEIRAIGYAPVRRPNVPVREGAQVDLGTVAMRAVAVQLAETRVTAERDLVTLAPDRSSYTVRDMPVAAGGTAADVLRTVPGIEVDGENRISLRGNANVVVQVNGRATPMRGEQLGNFLAQLSSGVVQRVEVVASPSAREDPEGLGGIINLVLRQQADLGTSGGFVLSGGSTKLANASGNLGHQSGRVSALATLDLMRDERRMTGTTSRLDRANAGTPWLDTDHLGTMHPRSGTMTGQLEYRPRPADALSTNLLLSRRSFDRENANRYTVLDPDRAIVERYDRLGDIALDETTADLALTFRRAPEPQRRETSVEVRALRWTTDALSDQALQPLQPNGLPDGDRSREREAIDEARGELTVQADLTRPLGARAKIEAGYRGTARRLDNDLRISHWRAEDETYVEMPNGATFAYRDRIHAAYAVASSAFGRLNAQAGLRAELAATEFDAGTGGRFENDYRSLYPSAILTFDATARRQFRASYSRRVQRPETRQMNPADRPHEDRTNIFRGNPYLQPEYTNAFELGWQEAFGTGTLQVTPFLRRTVDAIRLTRFIDDSGSTVTTFANLASSTSWGVDANGSFRAGRLSGFAGASAFRVASDGTNLEREIEVESFVWSARANGTLRLTPSLDGQAFVMYRAPSTGETGRSLAQTFVNFALRQKVAGDRGSLTLRIQDPFRTMRFGSDQTDGAVTQTTIRRFAARSAVLVFGYNFGTAPKLRPRAVEQAAEPGM